MTEVDTEEWRVGQLVRIRGTSRRAEIVEVDAHLHVVRVALHTGGEQWCLLDDVEVIPSWSPRSW